MGWNWKGSVFKSSLLNVGYIPRLFSTTVKLLYFSCWLWKQVEMAKEESAVEERCVGAGVFVFPSEALWRGRSEDDNSGTKKLYFMFSPSCSSQLHPPYPTDLRASKVQIQREILVWLGNSSLFTACFSSLFLERCSWICKFCELPMFAEAFLCSEVRLSHWSSSGGGYELEKKKPLWDKGE